MIKNKYLELYFKITITFITVFVSGILIWVLLLGGSKWLYHWFKILVSKGQ